MPLQPIKKPKKIGFCLLKPHQGSLSWIHHDHSLPYKTQSSSTKRTLLKLRGYIPGRESVSVCFCDKELHSTFYLRNFTAF